MDFGRSLWKSDWIEYPTEFKRFESGDSVSSLAPASHPRFDLHEQCQPSKQIDQNFVVSACE
jgi:hypothetical protein